MGPVVGVRLVVTLCPKGYGDDQASAPVSGWGWRLRGGPASVSSLDGGVVWTVVDDDYVEHPRQESG